MPKREDKKQLNAFIPVDLHTRLKLQAVSENRAMAQILEEAIEDYLQKGKKVKPK